MKSYGERGFLRYLSRAALFLDDSKKSSWLLKKALFKSKRPGASMIRGISNIRWMIMLFGDWIKGRYKDISRGTLLAITAAILYFVSPVDFIIDYIPFGGFIDDAAVITFVLGKVNNDIEKYKLWRDLKDNEIEVEK